MGMAPGRVEPQGALPMDEETRRKHLVRAVAASTIGTTVEWYDFYLYGSAAALVLPRLFFSSLDPALASILSWVTFYAGFVGRPVGAAIFGITVTASVGRHCSSPRCF